MYQVGESITREELQNIEKRARKLSEVGNLSTAWKMAFEQLAFAASTLDAFIARTEV